jgi:hypothetical protein
LATDPPSQRAYRAACPNCGAPVEFRSAASAFAVCSFCKSQVVRDGDTLRKIGESAELFDDHSPLQLGAGGTYQGAAFTLVGRLQYRYAEGTWNEWHALFDNGRSGWLSEDNGRYVMSFEAPLAEAPPVPSALRPGAQQIVNGQPFSVASITVATLIAAQGELPSPPEIQRGFVVADLRSTAGEVGTLDYSRPDAPTWSVGRSVAISELRMSGLAEAGEKTLAGRTIQCPSCGSALEIQLASTQSIVCFQCRHVVDVSKGVGGELAHFAQDPGDAPQIPLGTVGTLALTRGQPLPWQVVGYVERAEVAENEDDENSFWREYLLYHREEGFAFLVDAEDGWSWSAPITGAPQTAGDGVKLDGVTYRKLYDYTGQVTYVLGEFYWQLKRRERTFNTDYIGTGSDRDKRLNRERTGSGETQEIVWSAGETITADAVAQAFRLGKDKLAALQRDAGPTSGQFSTLTKVLVVLALVVVMLMIVRCSRNEDTRCDHVRSTFGASSLEYQNCLASSGSRGRGGSFGGFSSGGGHK